MAENKTETVEELTPGMTGRWLVTTQGSTHVWDLDRMLYTRLPGEQSLGGPFALDGESQSITRIGRYPRVGETSLVIFDEPSDPAKEHWRQSSVIKKIERLADTELDQGDVRALVEEREHTDAWAFLSGAVRSAIQEQLAPPDTTEDQP